MRSDVGRAGPLGRPHRVQRRNRFVQPWSRAKRARISARSFGASSSKVRNSHSRVSMVQERIPPLERGGAGPAGQPYP